MKKNSPLWGIIFAGFFVISGLSSKAQAGELYLQGMIGYSFVEGTSYQTTMPGEPFLDDPLTTDIDESEIVPDPVITDGSVESRGLGNVMGLEAGFDGLGDKGRIRAGISQQEIKIAYKNGLNGIALDEDNLVPSKMTSFNLYYFLFSRAEKPEGWRPYLGVGMGKIDVDPIGIDQTMIFHLGAEKSVNSRLSLGGKYSYLHFKDKTADFGDGVIKASPSAIHFLSATLTYHLTGF